MLLTTDGMREQGTEREEAQSRRKDIYTGTQINRHTDRSVLLSTCWYQTGIWQQQRGREWGRGEITSNTSPLNWKPSSLFVNPCTIYSKAPYHVQLKQIILLPLSQERTWTLVPVLKTSRLNGAKKKKTNQNNKHPCDYPQRANKRYNPPVFN